MFCATVFFFVTFCSFVETVSHYIALAGLELDQVSLQLTDTPASVS